MNYPLQLNFIPLPLLSSTSHSLFLFLSPSFPSPTSTSLLLPLSFSLKFGSPGWMYGPRRQIVKKLFQYQPTTNGPFKDLLGQHSRYRVFIKNCVFSLEFCDCLNSASFAAALVFYLPGVCTHTDTEGKQSPEYF